MFFDSSHKVINELVWGVDRVVRKRGSIIQIWWWDRDTVRTWNNIEIPSVGTRIWIHMVPLSLHVFFWH